ncbi:Mth938-like domain-containing protein [Micromonosporaceae bacterium Da 78-11]
MADGNDGPRSPQVSAVSWGHMDVDGLAPGKDFKLYPGGGRAWDWSETGTRHHPGVQPADVEELLAAGAEVVVLSRGMDLQLEVDPRTLEWLGERGVEVHVGETTEAVRTYNELALSRPVGGLFHSTC